MPKAEAVKRYRMPALKDRIYAMSQNVKAQRIVGI